MSEETIVAQVPVEVSTPPATITWGWKSFWHKPTPVIASQTFNFILGGAFVVVVAMHSFPIPHGVQDQVNEIALGVITFSRVVCKAFGITIKDVDTTNVK